jgi:phenylpropionate dioxygenase-like ring-hydroxylating dioxygenase large terminal subunit
MRDVSRFFHPIMPSTSLARGPHLVRLAGQRLALFRDNFGVAAALADACPHRKAPLSEGHVRPDGRLACPYHGWHFDKDGCGVSPSQPDLKKCDTSAYQVVERYGYVWVAARNVPLSAFPKMEWPEEGFELFGAFAERFDAPLHVAFDNFSEDEHTPWVHTFLGWNERSLEGGLEFEANNYDDRTEVRYVAPQRDHPWRPILLTKKGDLFHNDWVTRFDPVRTIYTLYWSDPKSKKVRPIVTRAAIYFVPETDRTTWLHTFAYGKMADRRLRFMLPIVRKAVLHLARNEVRDDQKFVPKVADTPFDMKGMRLGKYDKPLVHNHKLLSRLYWGEEPMLELVDVQRRAEG